MIDQLKTDVFAKWMPVDKSTEALQQETDPTDPTKPDGQEPVPSTGGRSDLSLWFCVMALALTVLFAAAALYRKKEN